MALEASQQVQRLGKWSKLQFTVNNDNENSQEKYIVGLFL